MRETIEDYLNHLDRRDWDSVAACFTDDAVSSYNDEPQPLHGGRAVTAWLQNALRTSSSTVHALAHLRIELDGTIARCDSRVTASLLLPEPPPGQVAVRALAYKDELVESNGTWLIRRRVHQPLWQYETVPVTPRIPRVRL